jgi:hypothetical protein
MAYEYGPLDTYEVIWNSGQIEYIQAHQVIMPPIESPFSMGAGVFGSAGAETKQRGGWTFHGQIDGRWRLLLSAPAEDIKSVRNVTHTTDRAGGGA